MKLTEIKIQITKRIGNYESSSIGGTWAVSDDEKRQEQELFSLCNNNILQVFATNYNLPVQQQPVQQPQQPVQQPQQPVQQPQQPVQPQQQKVIQKKKLTIDSPELSAVTKRISEGVSVEEVLKYYDVDDKMLAILHLAEGK